MTFPDHYPDAVRDLMLPMVSIKLSVHDAQVSTSVAANTSQVNQAHAADYWIARNAP
ncbi:MAG: hypothetical protein ACRCS3_09030 [Paracoccaceae bacterium]